MITLKAQNWIMFASSPSVGPAAQQTHHLNHLHSNLDQQQQTNQQQLHHQQHQSPHPSDFSNLSTNQQFVSQPLFSLIHGQHQSHGAHHQQPLQSQAQTVMPQFLETNQYLVAHFNQEPVSGHFGVDTLSVSDATQFVSVMQQQQQQHSSSHLQDAGRFDATTFFHQPSFNQHHTTTLSKHNQPHQPQQNQHNHHHQQEQEQQLISTDVITTDAPNLSLTNTIGHVSINPGVNSIFRLNTTTSTNNVSGDQTTLMMDAINNLREQRPIMNCNNITTTSNAICSNNVCSHRSSSSSSNSNSSSGCGSNLIRNSGPIVTKSATNSSSSNNDIALSISMNYNGYNNSYARKKVTNNKVSESHTKREKLESSRNSESPRRIFSCPTCCKGFTEKFNMKRHMQIHSQSRPKYTCNECSKSFAWKDNFIRHKKAAHATSLQQYQVQ